MDGNGPRAKSKHLKWAIALLIIVTVVLVFLPRLATEEDRALPKSEPRMPVTNPPLEPDRPDLIGEPRIEDPPPPQQGT